jgi:ceramide glucosyltransferase
MIALSLWHHLGLKHAMAPDVAIDSLGEMSFKDYINRRVRWIRVRKKMTLPATLAEPLTESIICGLYGSWAFSRLIGIPRALFFILHMVAWLAVDMDVMRSLAVRLQNPQGSSPDFVEFIFAWALRETLALPVWLMAMCGSTVTWRGVPYHILANGETERVAPSGRQ